MFLTFQVFFCIRIRGESMESPIAMALLIVYFGSASLVEGLLESDYIKKLLLRMETAYNLNTELHNQLDAATNLNTQLQTDIQVPFYSFFSQEYYLDRCQPRYLCRCPTGTWTSNFSHLLESTHYFFQKYWKATVSILFRAWPNCHKCHIRHSIEWSPGLLKMVQGQMKECVAVAIHIYTYLYIVKWQAPPILSPVKVITHFKEYFSL